MGIKRSLQWSNFQKTLKGKKWVWQPNLIHSPTAEPTRRHVTNQFTCLPYACKACVFNFRLSKTTTWWLFQLLLRQEGSTLTEHLAITSKVSSTSPTLCGKLLSPSFPLITGHLWLLSIASVIERAIMSANDKPTLPRLRKILRPVISYVQMRLLSLTKNHRQKETVLIRVTYQAPSFLQPHT